MERKNKESTKDQKISPQRRTTLKHSLMTMTIVSSLVCLLLGTLPSQTLAGSIFHYIPNDAYVDGSPPISDMLWISSPSWTDGYALVLIRHKIDDMAYQISTIKLKHLSDDFYGDYYAGFKTTTDKQSQETVFAVRANVVSKFFWDSKITDPCTSAKYTYVHYISTSQEDPLEGNYEFDDEIKTILTLKNNEVGPIY